IAARRCAGPNVGSGRAPDWWAATVAAAPGAAVAGAAAPAGEARASGLSASAAMPRALAPRCACFTQTAFRSRSGDPGSPASGTVPAAGTPERAERAPASGWRQAVKLRICTNLQERVVQVTSRPGPGPTQWLGSTET